MNLHKVMEHDNSEENGYCFYTPGCFISELDLFFSKGSTGQSPAQGCVLLRIHGLSLLGQLAQGVPLREERIRGNRTKCPHLGAQRNKEVTAILSILWLEYSSDTVQKGPDSLNLGFQQPLASWRYRPTDHLYWHNLISSLTDVCLQWQHSGSISTGKDGDSLGSTL